MNKSYDMGKIEAKLESMHEDIKDLKENFKEQVRSCDARFSRSEQCIKRNELAVGKIMAVAGAITTAISIFIGFAIKLLWR